MPTDYGIGFDDLQRIQCAGSQSVKLGKRHSVEARETDASRGLATEHVQLVRSPRISAASEARDRNKPANAYQVSLQRSRIDPTINRFVAAD